MYIIKLIKRWGWVTLLGAWLLGASGMPTSVWGAGCLETANSEFCMVVDAASTCEALSSNMSGCTTDSNGFCTIVNPTIGKPNIVVKVNPGNAVGSVPNPDLGEVEWVVTQGPDNLKGKEIDLAILLGATGGGTSAWIYSPGAGADSRLAFEKSNGSYQKVNGIFFCSDFSAPPASLPQLTLKKTVMLANGTCGADDVENLSLKVGMKVRYCFEVQNVGIGAASNVSLFDPDAPPADPLDYELGNLGPLETRIITSPEVTISAQGETVNLATVSGDAAEDPLAVVPDATDTATVNAQLALEDCPADVQAAVDNFTDDEGFKYAALLDPLRPERVSVCVPSENAVGGGVQDNISCLNQCILKEICKDPGSVDYDPAECEPPSGSKCVESGNWSVGVPGACTAITSEQQPFCWEAIQDRDQNCSYKPVEVLKSTDINIQQFHENPFCYLSCADVDELTSCNYICF